MGKNNRQRRASKRRRERTRQRLLSARAQKRGQRGADEKLVYRSIENPFQGLTDEQTKAARCEIARTARTKYAAGLVALEQSLRDHDPLHALGMLARYGLMTGVGPDGVDGTGDLGETITQAHVEFYQALLLRIPLSDAGTDPVLSQDFESLYTALSATLEAVSFRDLDTFDDGGRIPSVVLAQAYVRARTRTVRNWGYHGQVKRIVRALYAPFDTVGNETHAFSPLDVVALFEHLLARIETTSTEVLTSLATVLHADDEESFASRYAALLELSPEEAQSLQTLVSGETLTFEQRRAILLGHHNLLQRALFMVDPKSVARALSYPEPRVIAILNAFALVPGELQDANVEHLHLANPIWLRPIIHGDDGTYFCALPQTFFSHVLPALDCHFEPLLNEALSDRRAAYLEEATERLLRSAFPDAHYLAGLTWEDEGVRFETDLLVIVDSIAVIVEAKSGRITDPALRGADVRMRRHFEELLVAPNRQSRRLMEKLARLQAGEEIDDEFASKLPVDISVIRQVVRLSITLDDFATLQANVNRWKDTGWLPDDYLPCPTLCLSDLETLIDLLEDPYLIMHYLQVRQEIEMHVDYIGDELDLIGFYLQTGFDLAVDDLPTLTLSGLSSTLDRYYTSREAGVAIPKPSPLMKPRFKRILEQLRGSRPNWLEIGVIVARFGFDQEDRVERSLARCKRNVRRHPLDPDVVNTFVLTGPEHVPYALTFVVFGKRSRHRRREFLEGACHTGFDSAHVKVNAVFLLDADDDGTHAYDHVALAWPDDSR